MKPNLDTLKAEIPAAIESRSLGLFPSFSRVMEHTPTVFWNTSKNPDYVAFLDTAERLGAKVIVFHDREFTADLVDDALDRLEDSDLPREEQRGYDRRLREMRVYDGFTCSIELSFDLSGVTYMFELHTEWYDELNQIMDDIDSAMPEEDERDEGGPLGGYFSKN